MANEFYYVSAKNRRLHTPFMGTIVYGMALDYYSAPQWLWAVTGTILALYWILYLVEGFKVKHKIVEFTKDGWKVHE